MKLLKRDLCTLNPMAKGQDKRPFYGDESNAIVLKIHLDLLPLFFRFKRTEPYVFGFNGPIKVSLECLILRASMLTAGMPIKRELSNYCK